MDVPNVTAPDMALAKKHAELKEAATELEAVFLSEMLKSAGFGETSEAFGGGVGEEQFSSFLADQQARAFSKAGGVGLAEHIFKAMVARET